MATEPFVLSTAGPDTTQDPYPEYAAARKAGPLAPAVLMGMPGWVAAGHTTARELFSDPRLSSDPAAAAPRLRELAPWAFATQSAGFARSMLRTDPPDHTRLRRLVSTAFTARRTEALRPRIQQISDGLLAPLPARGHADLIDDYAAELPLLVIMELLGVPSEERHYFRSQSLVAISAPEDPAVMFEALGSVRDHLDGLIARKRAENTRTGGPDAAPDLLSELIAARDRDDDRLSDTELRAMAFLLLLAGHETTTNLIGNGMLALLRDPEKLERLRADPSLTPVAVEEFLRLDSPVVIAGLRFATEEIRLGDAVVAPGDAVFIAGGAAGRDPEIHQDPDVLDFGRTRARHLGFGHGVHFCLGAPLARLEADIAFRGLLSALPDIALAVPENELRRRRNPNVRGLRHLPVTFTPRPA
ncbi:cytochrome P450 [Streptomyces sp. CAU 1734]|uniref:cytochrome P450 family protein n=1 Tax=Streptomyces sp. CAU 1734 TaxID=3140360 RepID=UPI0032612A3B